jgi:hypothetical protein
VFSFWVVSPDVAPTDGAMVAATLAELLGVVGVLELLHAVKASALIATAESAMAAVLVFMELLSSGACHPDGPDLTSD